MNDASGRELAEGANSGNCSPCSEASERSGGSGRFVLILGASAAILIGVCILGLTMGPSSVSVTDIVNLITGQQISQTAESIILHVRLPRVLGAVFAGSALAVSGAVIQSVLDNPLASPNIIGINSGAGLAVLLAASMLPHMLWLLPLAAFLGSLITAALIFGISAGSSASKLTVILAGIAITTVFGAGMNTILIVNPDAYVGSATFLVGGLSGVMLSDIFWPAIYIVAGVLLSLMFGSKLNLLALGDQTAHSLGVNVARTRLLLLGLAAILAGAAVSIAGLLGFVGLIIPHVMRFFVGHDNRKVIPVSIFAGAAFVVGCDVIARTLFAPYELPVGILMAFLGGPFFIYLILCNRREGII